MAKGRKLGPIQNLHVVTGHSCNNCALMDGECRRLSAMEPDLVNKYKEAVTAYGLAGIVCKGWKFVVDEEAVANTVAEPAAEPAAPAAQG